MEKAFSDFHQRYIKSKEAVQVYQQVSGGIASCQYDAVSLCPQNETKLQGYIKELEDQVKTTEEQIKQLREETADKLHE